MQPQGAPPRLTQASHGDGTHRKLADALTAAAHEVHQKHSWGLVQEARGPPRLRRLSTDHDTHHDFADALTAAAHAVHRHKQDEKHNWQLVQPASSPPRLRRLSTDHGTHRELAGALTAAAHAVHHHRSTEVSLGVVRGAVHAAQQARRATALEPLPPSVLPPPRPSPPRPRRREVIKAAGAAWCKGAAATRVALRKGASATREAAQASAEGLRRAAAVLQRHRGSHRAPVEPDSRPAPWSKASENAV